VAFHQKWWKWGRLRGKEQWEKQSKEGQRMSFSTLSQNSDSQAASQEKSYGTIGGRTQK